MWLYLRNSVYLCIEKYVLIMNKSMYDSYMKMEMVPAGAILDHIVSKQQRTKTEIAALAGLIPQRLNDLIKGNRRFTPQVSIALEKALGIDQRGFFYLLQTNHDIYLAKRTEMDNRRTPNLRVLTKTTFWDVDVSKIDWLRAQQWALRRVLEYGNAEEIRELDRFYGHEALLSVLINPAGFRLYDQAKLNYERAMI